MEGGSSGQKKLIGNMKIKLKIPKQLVPPAHRPPIHEEVDDELEEGEIREEPDQVSVANNNPPPPTVVIKTEISVANQDQEKEVLLRICPVCSKGFISGKALGGHMRIHASDSPNQKPVRNNKVRLNPNLANPNPNLSPNQKFKCEQCDKEFRSEKSLFGHMRSHPERNWRGMHPPREARGDAGPSRGEITWKKRGRRGLKGKEEKDTSSSSTMLSPGVAAAASLVHISGGGHDKGKRVINGKEYDSDEIYFLSNMGCWDFPISDDDDDHDGGKEKENKRIRVSDSTESDSHNNNNNNNNNNKANTENIHNHTHIHTHIHIETHLHIAETTTVPKPTSQTSDEPYSSQCQSTLEIERGRRDNSIEFDLNEEAMDEVEDESNLSLF